MNVKGKIVGFLNRKIRKGNWYSNVKFPDCQKFWNYKTFDTEVVNLGSTSAVSAFCYDEIPLKCANWALSVNPLMGDFAILKNYFGYLREKGSTVIIPLCPFTSLSGSYSITEDKYYSLLYPSSIPAYSYRRHQQIKNGMRSPLDIYPVKPFIYDLKCLFSCKNLIMLSEQQMLYDAERWMENWMKEFNIIDFSHPLSLVNKDGIDDASNILNDIISFCKEREIRPVILIPPVYHTLGERLTPDIRKIIIDSLIERIEDRSIWFHNYMDESEFSNNISYFQNSFLMNKKGARLFTRRVLNDLGLVR